MINHLYITAFVVLLNTVPVFSKTENKQEQLELTIHKVIEAYDKKDAETLNTLIHPTRGLYFILSASNTEFCQHRSKICLTTDCIGELNLPPPYNQIILEQKLNINIDSAFEEKNRISIDYEHLHKLSKLIRNSKQRSNIQIEEKELKEIWKTERRSKRIVVSKAQNAFWEINFTFYLSYINNNWYLSTIDFTN